MWQTITLPYIKRGVHSKLKCMIIAELVTIAAALAQPPFLDLTAAGQFLEQLPQEAAFASVAVLRGEDLQCLAYP